MHLHKVAILGRALPDLQVLVQFQITLDRSRSGPAPDLPPLLAIQRDGKTEPVLCATAGETCPDSSPARGVGAIHLIYETRALRLARENGRAGLGATRGDPRLVCDPQSVLVGSKTRSVHVQRVAPESAVAFGVVARELPDVVPSVDDLFARPERHVDPVPGRGPERLTVVGPEQRRRALPDVPALEDRPVRVLAFCQVVVPGKRVATYGPLVLTVEIESVFVDIEELIVAIHERLTHHVPVKTPFDGVPTALLLIEPRVVEERTADVPGIVAQPGAEHVEHLDRIVQLVVHEDRVVVMAVPVGEVPDAECLLLVGSRTREDLLQQFLHAPPFTPTVRDDAWILDEGLARVLDSQ